MARPRTLNERAGSGSTGGGRGGFTLSHRAGIATPSAARKPSPKKKHHGGGGILGGIGGFAKHLAGDIEDMAVGIGPGLVTAGGAIGHDVAAVARSLPKHPENAYLVPAVVKLARGAGEKSQTYKRVVAPVGKSYADTYGPLFHGDIKQFLRNVEEHPLGPILDALAVATLGAGAAAKAGKVLATTGVVSKESRIARLGEHGTIELRSAAARAGERGAPTVVKRTSRNPAIRARQQATAAMLAKAPSELPLIGEDARFWRAARRDPHARAQVMRQQAGPYQKAYGKLSAKEKQAFGVLARVPLPAHLDGWKQQLAGEVERGGEDAARLLETLNDPKVVELYHRPTEKMLAAHAEAEKLGAKAAQTLERLGVLSRQEAEAARYRHSRIAAGADVYTAKQAAAVRRSLIGQIRRLERDQRQIDRQIGKLRTSGTPESRAARGYAAKTASMADRAARRRQATARTFAEWEAEGRLPDFGLEQAAVATRRPVELQMLEQARQDVASRLGAGRAELGRLDELEQELAVRREMIEPGIVGGPSVDEIRAEIAAAGRPQPIYIPDVPETIEKPVRTGGGGFTYGNPVRHSEGVLFTTGRLALKPDLLGPNFLRVTQFALYRDLHDLLLDSSVRVPGNYQLQHGEGFVRRPVGLEGLPELDRLVEDPTVLSGSRFADRGLITGDHAEAVLDHGHRFVVSARLARQVQTEFGRSSNAAVKFIARSTTVWRALVLNLRVAWLVNNIVGNHLLYALKHAGPAGLRAYLNAVRTARGPTAVRELLGIKTPDALTPEDIAELLPEQAAGTFIGTQAPNTRTGGIARKLGAGLSKANQANEGMLRRAAAEAELRRSPAVRARRKAMPKETRSFRAAARQELEHNPELAREISREVNDALGDYLSMGPFERRYLRALFPFWAWYRAISTIALHLPLNYPGRTDLLAKISAIGLEQAEDELGPLPSFLRGAVPIGENRLLKTQPVNPFGTIPQLGRAAAVPFLPGAQTNQLAGLANPFIQAGGSLLFGRERTKHGLAADFLAGFLTDLPQVALARSAISGPKSSKLYEPSTLDDLLAFLGAPTKTIKPARAQRLARQGR